MMRLFIPTSNNPGIAPHVDRSGVASDLGGPEGFFIYLDGLTVEFKNELDAAAMAKAILRRLGGLPAVDGAELKAAIELLRPLARPVEWVSDKEDDVYLGTQLHGVDNDCTPTLGECRAAAAFLSSFEVV